MSAAAYMKIPGVKGECKVKGKDEYIELSSWSWGLDQPSTMATGGGGGKSRVTVSPIMATKSLDTSSPNLMQMCCSGEHYPEIKIEMEKAGGKGGPVPYLNITLKKAMITNVAVSASGEGDIFETIGLAFEEFKYEYTPQTGKGGKGGASDASWNIAQNTIP